MPEAPRIPKLVAGMDVRALPLAPVDGFVLSRIDGTQSVRDIANTTGLGEDVVEGSLAKLRSLGIVQFLGESVGPPPRTVPAPPPTIPAPPRTIPPGARPTPPPRPPGPPSTPASDRRSNDSLAAGPRLASDLPPRYDPRELDEECDLDARERKRVLDIYYELDEVDFYGLLGVSREADKKAIKRAYFELAAHFHPDKFFRKNLGSFKQKMEVIFGRVTEAHDTLTSKQRRPEYDAYLDAQAQARGIEAKMAGARVQAQRAQEDLRRDVPSAPPSLPPPSIPPSPIPPRAPLSTAPADAARDVPRAPSTPADPRELREALARRLRGGTPMRPAPAQPAPAPPVGQASSREAMDALRRRFDDRRAEAARAQATKYRTAGDEARKKGDMVGAATAYRVAASFLPNDDELRTLFTETQERADALLGETYMKQATYEERSGHWPDAARSWGRVVRARRGDAEAHDRLAHALVQAGGNLHEAADAAKRAIELAPQVSSYRVTLAHVFLAAGLTIAAKREIENAAKIDPNSPAIAAYLKRLQKT